MISLYVCSGSFYVSSEYLYCLTMFFKCSLEAPNRLMEGFVDNRHKCCSFVPNVSVI